MKPQGSQRRWYRLMAVAIALALLGTACGGDDGNAEDNPSTTGGANDTTTTTDPGDPIQGGEATVLLFSEIGTLDPVKMTGSGGSDGMRAFALYGALIAFDSDENKTLPVLAESFEPNEDASVWTLTLKPGLTFSDGTPFDAEAVKVNWERAMSIENRSPALTVMLAVASMTVVDDVTLQVTLSSPNAQFDNSISRVSSNYIASPTAIAAGTDLTSKAVGAGPFLLENWIRDDRMIMKANPDWKGSDGPYLDQLVFRVVGNEDQRVDTFITGDADAFYTSTPSSAARAADGVDGAEFTGVVVNTGQVFMLNNSKPPFDDLRVRKAFAQGVDWNAMAESVFGEGSKAPEYFALESTPWFTPDAELPVYDVDAAQALIDDYVADNGGQPVQINLLSFEQTLDQARGKYVQTSLNQLENVNVDIDVNDSPTNIGKVLAGDYMASSWGTAVLYGDQLWYNVHSTSFTNFGKYANSEVDALLDQARATRDEAAAIKLYQQVYTILAEDLPVIPYLETENGFVTAPDLHGAQLYLDGIMRFDLLWKSE